MVPNLERGRGAAAAVEEGCESEQVLLHGSKEREGVGDSVGSTVETCSSNQGYRPKGFKAEWGGDRLQESLVRTGEGEELEKGKGENRIQYCVPEGKALFL